MSKKQYIEENKINLKGKDYLQVMHRVVMFRKDHPDWCIETDVGEQSVRASVRDGNGRLLATAHRAIKPKGEARGPAGDNPLETAETGAIGRALGLCGYGTLAGDLDEGEELADAPVEKEFPPKGTGAQFDEYTEAAPKSKKKTVKQVVHETVDDEGLITSLLKKVSAAKTKADLEDLRGPLRTAAMILPVENPLRQEAFDLFLKREAELS